MTPIEEQIEFAKQRYEQAKETQNHDEQIAWKAYKQALEYAKLWYESAEGKQKLNK